MLLLREWTRTEERGQEVDELAHEVRKRTHAHTHTLTVLIEFLHDGLNLLLADVHPQASQHLAQLAGGNRVVVVLVKRPEQLPDL